MRCVIQTGPDGLDQTLTVECERTVDGVPQTITRTYRLDEMFRKVWEEMVRRYGAPADPVQAASVSGWRDTFRSAVKVSRRAIRNKAVRSILNNPAAGIAAGLIPGGASGLAAAKLIAKASQGSPAAKAKIRKIKAMAKEDPRAAESLALLRKVKAKMETIAASQVAAPVIAPTAESAADPAVSGPFRSPSRWLIDQFDGRPGVAISARALYSRGLGQVDQPTANVINYARHRIDREVHPRVKSAIDSLRNRLGF